MVATTVQPPIRIRAKRDSQWGAGFLRPEWVRKPRGLVGEKSGSTTFEQVGWEKNPGFFLQVDT